MERDVDFGGLTAPAESDWFIDPATGQVTSNAPLVLTPVGGGDFQFRARVAAGLRNRFDAVAVFVHGGDATWAKLALERSPVGADTVVTVVTRGVSDDANGVALPVPGSVWLRVSRVGHVYAFHHSWDGQRWDLDRLFTLGSVDGHRVGLCVQSPLGDGLTASASDVALTATTLVDARDGS